MTNRKRVFWATTALFSGLLVAGAASAQSTGTVAAEATELDTVVVTGVRGPATTDGTIIAETVAKSRSSITQEFISTQSPGQTILQTLNLVPGLNFTNADPFGNSGGNIRLRGFDGSRVSLTFDGIPLNDTGNYAVYSNQQLDPELVERASVNLGTTDVDSPTASATGGTINYTVSRPTEEAGVQVGGPAGVPEPGPGPGHAEVAEEPGAHRAEQVEAHAGQVRRGLLAEKTEQRVNHREQQVGAQAHRHADGRERAHGHAEVPAEVVPCVAQQRHVVPGPVRGGRPAPRRPLSGGARRAQRRQKYSQCQGSLGTVLCQPMRGALRNIQV